MLGRRFPYRRNSRYTDHMPTMEGCGGCGRVPKTDDRATTCRSQRSDNIERNVSTFARAYESSEQIEVMADVPGMIGKLAIKINEGDAETLGEQGTHGALARSSWPSRPQTARTDRASRPGTTCHSRR